MVCCRLVQKQLNPLTHLLVHHHVSHSFFIFSKVSLLEDSDSNIHLKNLSLHQASNEEEGMEDRCNGVVIMWYSV